MFCEVVIKNKKTRIGSKKYEERKYEQIIKIFRKISKI